MKSTEDLFARLQELGAGEFAHLNGPLAQHLRGTERLLRQWGAEETVCVAGLFHAVYGTDGYNTALMSLGGRRAIAELIGDDAEALAYLFGACNREVFYPRIGRSAQLMFADRFTGTEYELRLEQLRQLCELTLANEMEIAYRDNIFGRRHIRQRAGLFRRMEGLVSAAAFRAYRSFLH